MDKYFSDINSEELKQIDGGLAVFGVTITVAMVVKAAGYASAAYGAYSYAKDKLYEKGEKNGYSDYNK